ncbi:hypothetical protein [Aeromonas hydrophila]|uniref:hypothetical protein n=1 Tax=Aeromonas hydrophila TaxID=644 RepID=UPI002B47AE0A|nr:hypothetical protein [Aeromonas hydrophila]
MNFIKFQNFTFFFSIYSLVVSTLYLLGFWGRFNIQILDFINMSDIVTLAIKPLLTSAFIAILSSLFGYCSMLIQEKTDKLTPETFNSKESIFKACQSYIRTTIFISISTMIIITYFAFYESTSYFFSLAGMLAFTIFIFFYTPKETGFIFSDINNVRLEVALIHALAICFFCSYSTGVMNAEKVMRDGVNIDSEYIGGELKYVGTAGNYIFFFDTKKSIATAFNKDEIKRFDVKIELIKPIIN